MPQGNLGKILQVNAGVMLHGLRPLLTQIATVLSNPNHVCKQLFLLSLHLHLHLL
jgi:hypothetical protein